MIQQIVKRDGRVVPFELDKITEAIYKAAQALGGQDRSMAEKLATDVVAYLEQKGNEIPSVEQIQDAVEHTLIENGHARTAKEFILYRSTRHPGAGDEHQADEDLRGSDLPRGP